jgi:uncharacterized membrane protein
MTQLIAACFLFFAIHIFISGTPVRSAVTDAIGEQPFRGLFALTSLAAIVWMGFAFAATKNLEPIWAAPAWLRHAGGAVMLIAFLFAVIGIATPNPTSVQQEGLLKKGDEAAKGMVRITRHPFLWGAAIWAAFHIAVNGDRASLIFFGTFLIVALAGMVSIDAKRKRSMGAEWDAFAAKTSLIPFGAIVTGRNKLSLGEIGIVRLLAAVAVYALIFWGHAWLFGAAPY